MTPMVFILSLLLHRPPELVGMVYRAGGMDAVAVVACESEFTPTANRIERDDKGRALGTSWGLFQLFGLYHPQHQDDLEAHIAYGARFLAKCEREAGGDFARAVSIYNSGNAHRSITWGRRVKARRDALMHGAILYLSRRVIWR